MSQQQQKKEDSSTQKSIGSEFARHDATSSNSSGNRYTSQQTPAYQVPCSHNLYLYEAKRAGGVYERMMRVLSTVGIGGSSGISPAVNNCNNTTESGIRDVQVHRSNSGRQHTRVETELQPTGANTDLSINIIMDSDSNLSKAISLAGGQASIEYESLDQTNPSEEAPASPSGAADAAGGGNRSTDSADFQGGGADGGAGGSSKEDGRAVSPDDSSASATAPAAASLRFSDDDRVGAGARLPRADDFADDSGPPGKAPSAPAAAAAADPDSDASDSSLQQPQQEPPPPPPSAGRRRQGGRGSRTDSMDGGASPSGEGGGRRRAGRGSRTDDNEDGPQPSSSDLLPARLPTDDGNDDNDDDDDDDDDDEEDGEGEGEEGDMDDAQRHFKRFLDGEKVDALRGPGIDEEAKETRRKLPVGYLEKEGTVIGCMSVFADVHIKEFIVFLSDEMIQAFLVDPGRFRSVASRTKCEIEVTRRILNRRMGRYRWLKYLIVDIRGPSYSAIDQCDKMMTVLFPPYKGRKPYGAPSVVSLFLKENAPDNTDLYFNFQRTGPSQAMFGEIPLRAPFRKTKSRPLEQTPWKAVQKRQQWGTLEPKNDRMEAVMTHVYPERGGTYTAPLDHSIKWAEAAEEALIMAQAKDMARAQMLKSRKVDSEPLYANVFGD